MGFWAKIIGGFAMLAAIVGAFWYAYNVGLTKGTAKSEVAIAQYEGRVQELNRQLAEKTVQINERVITNYVTRRETIREVTYRNRDVIRNAVPEQSTLSEGWVYAHDQSVRILPIDFNLAANPAPSNTSDRDALTVVSGNYAIAEENAERQRQLQQWIRDQEAARAEINTSNR